MENFVGAATVAPATAAPTDVGLINIMDNHFAAVRTGCRTGLRRCGLSRLLPERPLPNRLLPHRPLPMRPLPASAGRACHRRRCPLCDAPRG